MNNKLSIVTLGIFSFLSFNYIALSHAAVVDFSQCSASSSFAVVTQSEGPTYACGGIDTGAGNPINVLNGNKYEAVTDFSELPAFKGLSFSRFYNSQSHANTALGYGWYSSFDIKLYEQPEIIQIRMETGQRINFKKTKIQVGKGQFIFRALAINPSDGWIEKKLDGSGWRWHKPNTQQDYIFQQIGGKDLNLAHLTAISASSPTDKNNPAQNFSFAYDQQQRLVVVKNGKGDQLAFSYALTRFGLPQITVNTPIGKYYYFLDKNNNLAQTVYPDGRRFKYSYNPKYQGGDIHNLTAKWAFNRKSNTFKPISEWRYDRQDRAILSQHADGIEKVSIQYDIRSTGRMPANYSTNKSIFKNIVTNSLGQKTSYSYQVDGTQFKLLETLGAGCSSCGEVNKRYRYNAQGLVTYAADLDLSGKVIRTFELKYNNYGEIISRTISGIGIQPQTTWYEYETYQVQQHPLNNTTFHRLTQLNQQDYRRLKAESRNSVVSGKQYHKQYLYNQNNQLISFKETGFSPLGDILTRETKYGYDLQGRLSWEDGSLPNGPSNSSKDSDITFYTYGKNGLLESWIVPLEHSKTVASYDQLGRVTQYHKTFQALDGKQQQQIFQFKFDGNNRYQEITLKTNDEKKVHGIRYSYDDFGRLQTMTDLNNQLIKTYKYDDANRLSVSLDKREGLIYFHYNTENNIIKKQNLTEKMFIETGYKYDMQGRLTTIADSKQGILSHIDYFSDGVSGRVLDQHGDELWLKYTANGQLQTQWRVPSQSEGLLPPDKTEHYYSNGIHRITQDDGTTTTRYTDDFGRLVILDSSIQGRIIYHLDAYGRYDQITYATGATLKYSYDDQGRVITKRLTQPAQDGLEKVNLLTTYTYSGNRITQIRDPHQILTFKYNSQGKLHNQSILYTGLSTPITTYYKYDNNGKPLSTLLPDGTNITADRKALYAQGAGEIFKTAFIRQDLDDNQLTYVLGNNLRLGFEYSSTGVWRGLHYISGTAKQSFSLIQNAYADMPNQVLLSQHWQYDAKHRIADVKTTGLESKQQGYLYDSRDHVISTFNRRQNSELKEKYFYDALGNRLMGQQLNSQTVGYRYQNSKLTTLKQDTKIATVTYNSMGQPIQYPTDNGLLQFSYINGQISQVWKNKKLIAAYSYNDAGQRIKKVLYVDTSGKVKKVPIVQYYYYNGTQLAGELDENGNILRQYIYTGNRLLATIDYQKPIQPITNPDILTKIRTVFNSIKGDLPQGKWHYILNDYMGHPRLVTNMKQQVVWQDDGQELFGASQLSLNKKQPHYQLNLRFIGQYADHETGLYYNGYRYYDPATGRYTTPDPLGLAGGENQYTYVNQQPNQYFDPQGLLLFAFDGTGNTDTNDNPSNVEKFMDAYASKGQFDVTQILWKNQEKKFTSNAGANLSPNHDNVFYIAGAGTEDQYTEIGSNSKALNALDNLTGSSLPNRVDQMLVYFSDYVHRLIDEQNKTGSQATAETIDIDIVGFSRGAASARLFASKLELLTSEKIEANSSAALLKPAYQSIGVESVLWDKDFKCKMEAAKISLNFRFMGLWDTVPALGLNPDNDMDQYKDLGMSLKVTNRFKNVAHAVAVNDHREGFMVRSIYDAPLDAQLNDGKPYKAVLDLNNWTAQDNTRIERGFMGAHSDIGGGYSEGDLSNVSLMWMIDQAKKAGIQFSDSLINTRQYNVVTEPIVHDSTGNEVLGDGRGELLGPYFDPGRDFAWANDDKSVNRINQHLTGMSKAELAQYVKGYANPQAEVQSGAQANHLVLNWKDTLQFQNTQYNASNLGKFEKLLKLEQRFTTDPNCKSREIIGGCKPLTEYQDLKSNDKTGSATIVYRASREDEAIQITNYLNWINTNYGTALTFKAADGVKAK